jgi:hypothetical protein
MKKVINPSSSLTYLANKARTVIKEEIAAQEAEEKPAATIETVLIETTTPTRIEISTRLKDTGLQKFFEKARGKKFNTEPAVIDAEVMCLFRALKVKTGIDVQNMISFVLQNWIWENKKEIQEALSFDKLLK